MTKENTKIAGEAKPDIRIKKTRPRRTPYYLLAVILVVVIVLIWAFHHHKNSSSNNAVFTVNGQQYTQAEVKNIIAYPLKFHPTERDSLTMQLYNYIRRQQAAIKLNIVPNTSEIDQAELTDFGAAQKSNLNKIPWIKYVSYDTALQQEISTNNVGTYAGYSYIFWFGQDLEKGPAYTSPTYGNQSQIASDKAYAKSRADYYYGKLADKSITPAAALSSIQKDSKLSFALPNNKFLSQSTQFSSSAQESWRSQVFYPDIANYIASQSKPGLSTVRTGQIYIGDGTNPKPSDYVDGYYYIVQLDQAEKAGLSNPNDFTKTVNQITAQYKGW